MFDCQRVFDGSGQQKLVVTKIGKIGTELINFGVSFAYFTAVDVLAILFSHLTKRTRPGHAAQFRQADNYKSRIFGVFLPPNSIATRSGVLT